MKKNEFAVVLASDNRGILPLSVTVFSLLNRTAFLKMLVMGVRNIRKYAPHAVQKEVTRKVTDMLRQENLYRPAEDDACLSRREGKLLKAWMGGKSGLDFSYYWKKMRKAGARLLRR